MSNRAIAFLGLYGLATVAALVFPPAGVWGFLFESNFPPVRAWWGGPLAALGERWSFFIGGVMAIAVLLHWNRYAHVAVLKHKQTILLILFSLNACLVSTWAYNVDVSWNETISILKWLLVYFCIVKTHSDRKWLPIIVCLYILACADVGWDNTLNPRGGRKVMGGPVSTWGENFLTAHMVALLPLAGLYALSPGTKRWLRLGCIVACPLMLNTVALGISRGAFLGLVAAGVATALFAQRRLRTIAILGLIAGSLLAVRLFDVSFWKRMETIQTYERDGSAMGRIEVWKDAWRAAGENPFGYGGEAFDLGVRTVPRTTHNTFFEVLVAWGWQGVTLFYGYVFLTMWDCWQLRNKSWRLGRWPPPREYLDAVGILAGIVSMLVTSFFLNRLRWELWWVFGAYVVCLKNICAAQPQDSVDEPVTATEDLTARGIRRD